MHRAILGGTLFLTIAGVLSVLTAQEPRRPAAPPSEEWEYYTASASGIVRRDGTSRLVVGVSTEKLNELGSEGWQLCEALQDYLVFRRPKQPNGARAAKEGTEPMVKGTVTLDGQPLTSGRILFHFSDAEFVGSTISENGVFALSRVPTEIMPVTIEGDAVPARYASKQWSGLQVEAKSGKTNVFTFVLKSK